MKRMLWGLLPLLLLAVTAVSGQLVLGDGEGDRSPVVFDHQGHTDALEAGDCTVCHARNGKGELVVTANREPSRADVHDRCADCHLARNQGPHPALCGACHASGAPQPTPHGVAAMAGFDHDAHTDGLDDDCSLCHHVFDPTAGRLVAADGDEAACSDCHEGAALQQAAHGSCVVCHEQSSGPITCLECHAEPGSGR